MQAQATLTSQTQIRRRHFISYLVLIAVTVVLMLPVVWMVLSSFKSDTEYLSYPIHVFPKKWRLENYSEAVTVIDYAKFAKNSVILATVFSTLTVLTSSMAGFGFARIDAPGRSRLFGIVVALLMVPYIVYVIPQFIIFAKLKLVNTYWPWVLWGLGASPFHIFLFRQYFTTIPRDLEDAAEVDGCGYLRIFWQIFLPNAKPVIAISFILNFVYVWGDWFTPIIYLNSDNTTLAAKLGSDYVDPMGNPLQTVTMAGSIIYALPLIIMFFLAQKHILKGIVTSGLKG
jgi:multiple sugar transport system permease protein